jgi:hypothetical protein
MDPAGSCNRIDEGRLSSPQHAGQRPASNQYTVLERACGDAGGGVLHGRSRGHWSKDAVSQRNTKSEIKYPELAVQVGVSVQLSESWTLMTRVDSEPRKDNSPM